MESAIALQSGHTLSTQRVRIGLIVNLCEPIAAADRLLMDALADSESFDVVRIVVIEKLQRSAALTAPGRTLLGVYRWFDRAVMAPPRSSTSPLKDTLSSCCAPIVVCADESSAICDLEAASADAKLDVLICLGSLRSVDAFSTLSKCGVWWVGPVDLPCAERSDLERLCALSGASTVLREGVWALSSSGASPVVLEFGTLRPLSRLSLGKNSESLGYLHRAMLSACLRREGVARQALSDEGFASSRTSPSATVTGRRLSRALATLVGRHISHRLSGHVGNDLWTIGIRARKEGQGPDSSRGYSWLQFAQGQWQADPFLFQRGGKTWLFYEEIRDPAAPAIIACAEISESGSPKALRAVLERPYHLSYPQVFCVGEDIFMLPETGTNGTVELYRAVVFPDQWELVRVLHRGPWFDTTVTFREEKFWFFSSLIEDRYGLASQLCLFSSPRIDGDWALHPQAPLSFDARYSRSAGSILEMGAMPIRPTQDCSRTYGEAVCFQRIERWNEKEYREVPESRLDPESFENAAGVHTYNRSEHFEVIDRKLRRRSR